MSKVEIPKGKIIGNSCIIYDDGLYIDVGETLRYSDRIDFFKKLDINWEHYRDNSYGYYNDNIGWCHRYSRMKLTNGELLKDVLYKLIDEAVKLYNIIYPSDGVSCTYDSTFNYIYCTHSYYHGGYHIPEAFKRYFDERLYTKNASKYFSVFIKEENIAYIKKAIKQLKKESPTEVYPEIGKNYILLKNTYIGTRFRLEKGTIFRITKHGSGWNNHTILKIINGRVATTTHSSFHNTEKIILNNVNGNEDKFYSLVEFKDIFGVELSDLLVSYDPYNCQYLPCKEIQL
jgi:hypothetical protein